MRTPHRRAAGLVATGINRQILPDDDAKLGHRRSTLPLPHESLAAHSLCARDRPWPGLRHQLGPNGRRQRCKNSREVATAIWNYSQGIQGVILSRDPNLARQHPSDYVTGAETTIRKALALAKKARERLPTRPGDRHRRRYDRGARPSR